MAGTRRSRSADADRLNPSMKRVPIIARVTVDHRSGLPGVRNDVRGELRLRPDGLKFLDDDGEWSIRIDGRQIKRILQPRRGLYPAEFTKRIEAQRKKVNAAKYALIDPLIYFGAQAAVSGAKQELAEARYGQPLSNRLVMILALKGTAVPVIFDVAGSIRAEVERAVWEFLVHLESHYPDRMEPSSGPAAPPSAGIGPGSAVGGVGGAVVGAVAAGAVGGGGAGGSVAVRPGWEPAGIRDRIQKARELNLLTGEDYGFLMAVLSGIGSAMGVAPTGSSAPGSGAGGSAGSGGSGGSATSSGWKLPDLSKVDWGKIGGAIFGKGSGSSTSSGTGTPGSGSGSGGPGGSSGHAGTGGTGGTGGANTGGWPGPSAPAPTPAPPNSSSTPPMLPPASSGQSTAGPSSHPRVPAPPPVPTSPRSQPPQPPTIPVGYQIPDEEEMIDTGDFPTDLPADTGVDSVADAGAGDFSGDVGSGGSFDDPEPELTETFDADHSAVVDLGADMPDAGWDAAVDYSAVETSFDAGFDGGLDVGYSDVDFMPQTME